MYQMEWKVKNEIPIGAAAPGPRRRGHSCRDCRVDVLDEEALVLERDEREEVSPR
jgi:hypothetical protein